jgi:predicted transcriptional regulator
MDTVPFQEHLEDSYSDEEIEQIRKEAAFDFVDAQLGEIRRRRGVTQEELAERMGITQPQLSKLENGDDFYLSTLRRYVDALNGEMDVVVTIDGSRTRVVV